MNQTPGTISRARLTARLAVALCMGIAVAAIPAVALAAPVTTGNAVASYDNIASISLSATTTPAGSPAYIGTRYRFDTSSLATVTAWPTAANVSIATYGSHTLEYFSVDADGVAEATQTKTFTIADTLSPKTISNVRMVYLDSASIQLLAADNVGGSGVAHVYYTVDGGPLTEGASITLHASGEHTLKFWSVDKAGNIEPMVSAPLEIIDSIAPVTTSDRVALYSGGSATILLKATDGGSGIDATYFSLDGAGFVAGTKVSVSAAGNHTLSFYSVDLAVNEEAIQTVTFAVEALATDSQAPVSTSNAAATYAASPALIRITSTDEAGGSGMAIQSYRVDGGSVVTVTANASAGLAVAAATPALGIPAGHAGGSAPTNCGCHPGIIPAGHSGGAAPTSCACHSIDTPSAPVDMPESHAGRVGNCDSCHPAAGVIMPVSATNPNHFGQSVGFVGGGKCETCHTFQVLDDVVPPTSMSTTVTVSGVGAHTIEFWGTDVAGNVETHKTVSFSITAVSPVLTYTAGAHGTIEGTSPQTVSLGSDGTTVTAIADSGYHFVSWSDGVTTAVRKDTNVTANLSVTASFASAQVATKLTMNVNPTRLSLGHSAHFFGVMSPNMPDRTPIRLMVRKAGQTKWTNLAPYVRTFGGYHWSFYYHPNTRGTYYFKVQFAATATHLGSTSRTVTVVWK